MRRAERLFRIVGMFQRKKVLTAAELAASLEVCERTIYRDLAHLQASGIGIEGQGGIGYVADAGLHLPPLNFSVDQIEALALGLSFVMRGGDPELASSAAAAQAKIDSVLPRTLTQGLAGSRVAAHPRASGRAPQLATAVRHALRSRTVIEFSYESENAVVTRRRLRPLALMALSNCWILSGWCELRQALRSFRLDRIRLLELTGDRFTSIPGYDIGTVLVR